MPKAWTLAFIVHQSFRRSRSGCSFRNYHKSIGAWGLWRSRSWSNLIRLKHILHHMLLLFHGSRASSRRMSEVQRAPNQLHSRDGLHMWAQSCLRCNYSQLMVSWSNSSDRLASQILNQFVQYWNVFDCILNFDFSCCLTIILIWVQSAWTWICFHGLQTLCSPLWRDKKQFPSYGRRRREEWLEDLKCPRFLKHTGKRKCHCSASRSFWQMLWAHRCNKIFHIQGLCFPSAAPFPHSSFLSNLTDFHPRQN